MEKSRGGRNVSATQPHNPMKLSDALNKTIADFCRNNFNTATDNHCAHFVCHVLELDTGFDCKVYKNGSFPGACIRVQELFAVCPEVGLWNAAPDGMKIVFVTDKANVDLAAHTMRNVPKKHVGIFSDGFVYNYSNTQDLVVRQTPPDFLARFQATYGGNQGLFFGTFPTEARIPDPETGAAPVAAVAATAVVVPQPTIREVPVSGRIDYFAKLPGAAEYYVARSTKYLSNRGLSQPATKLNGPQYSSAAFFDEYGSVAGMLGVIAQSESALYFNRLNSYDRAAFTFGFFQLAAHTPNDNLILLFRKAVATNAEFQRLFADLSLIDGVVHRTVGSHQVSLEKQYPRPGHPDEKNLKDFMNYLNPDLSGVDATELSAAARIIHLANSDASFNALQVNTAADITMGKIRSAYSNWYSLNQVSDLICTAIADIHHQGRGTKTQVRNALSSASTVKGKVSALCKIGEGDYPERCASLKSSLAKAEANGFLGISVFDKASGLFKPNEGWPG
jgi:hypothetical protein